MSRYPVEVEAAGKLAMFARPDTGITPTSYPAPPWAACKGLFEAIAMLGRGNAWIRPTKVEICKPRGAPGGSVRFQRYATNYGGPLRKAVLVKQGAGMQMFATVLADVCYRIHGEVEGDRPKDGVNPRHHLADLFRRRLRQGRCFRVPSLGWSEFTCSYWGPFREAFEVDVDLDLTIPSMLETCWSAPFGGRYEPRYRHDARIERGVLSFA